MTEQRHFRTAFAADTSLSADVRQWIAVCLRGWDCDQKFECRAKLGVSELFSNAVQHGSTSALDIVTVTCEYEDGILMIAVADSSSCLPVPRHAAGLEERGRGLHLVAEIAMGWGCDPEPDGGKCVWFTMSLTDDKEDPELDSAAAGSLQDAEVVEEPHTAAASERVLGAA